MNPQFRSKVRRLAVAWVMGLSAFTSGFVVAQSPPTITAVNPSSGAVGSSVTLTGSNFSATPANNIVYFGAVKAAVTAVTATSLTVIVSTDAPSPGISPKAS